VILLSRSIWILRCFARHKASSTMGCNSSTAAKPAAQPAAASDKTLISPTDVAKPDAAAKPKAPRLNVVEMLNNVFFKCDVNGDGSISREELAKAFDDLLQCSHKESGKSMKTLVMESGLNPYFNVFDQVDSDHDGKISLAEFQEHMHPAKAGKVIGQLLKEVFDGIDVNKDGNLDRKELQDAYGNLLNTTEEKSGKSWKNLMLDAGLNADFHVFEQLDTNHDGKVTWEEFRSSLQPQPDMGLFLRRTFDQIDANSDGSISKEELRDEFSRVLDLASPLAGNKTFRTMLAEAGINPDFCNFDKLDTNHDGKITWAEFEANLRPPDFKEAEQKVEEAPADTSPVVVVTDEVPKSSPCCC
jgi:Ca2+-binding EF-hand superfamily protein